MTLGQLPDASNNDCCSNDSSNHHVNERAISTSVTFPRRAKCLVPVAVTWAVAAVVTTVIAAGWFGWSNTAAVIDGDRSLRIAVAVGLLTAATLWPWVRWGQTASRTTWLLGVGSLFRVAGTVALFLAAGYQWTTWLVAAAWVLTWYVAMLTAEVVALGRFLPSSHRPG